MAPIGIIYFIIFLEGYIVLSTELLALRLLVPFTGSGTDTVSIIIAAILLPLAFGYYAGGRFGAARKTAGTSVRRKLVQNLVVAALILSLGLSYVFLNSAFIWVQTTFHIYNRLVLTSLYCAVFIVYPVFLLGQTVPLISNYFSRQRLSAIAGRILFFSTMGSFVGAIASTLVFMTFFGVHVTAVITVFCMALLAFILARRKAGLATGTITLAFLAALAMNSGYAMQRMNIVSNNKYSTIQVVDDGYGTRYLKLNGTIASAVYENAPDTVLEYATYIENNFLAPVYTEGEVKSVLILGAGGFTIGRNDLKNTYVYVDIDAALKDVAEKQFLKENLTPNKSFAGMDARAYLLQSHDKYDIIVLDLFRDPVSVHENLNTQEFFREVNDHLKDGGVMVANYWASPTFADDYSYNLDYTLRSVFPALNRQVINDYNVWQREGDWANVIYSAIKRNGPPPHLYTDDKNSIVFDKPVAPTAH